MPIGAIVIGAPVSGVVATGERVGTAGHNSRSGGVTSVFEKKQKSVLVVPFISNTLNLEINYLPEQSNRQTRHR